MKLSEWPHRILLARLASKLKGDWRSEPMQILSFSRQNWMCCEPSVVARKLFRGETLLSHLPESAHDLFGHLDLGSAIVFGRSLCRIEVVDVHRAKFEVEVQIFALPGVNDVQR